MRFKPLGSRVLVKRLEEEEEGKTSGGLYIPDTAKEKPQRGKIVAIGPGELNEEGKRVPMEVKKGDEILFGKYSGSEVKIDSIEYLIIQQSEILGTVG